MDQLTETKDAYVASFAQMEQAHRQSPPWLARLRRAGMARFAGLGFPTTSQEEWRFTNVAPIAKTVFAPARQVGLDALPGELPFADAPFARLVLVNGRPAPHLSLLGSLPEGVRVCSLSEAMRTDADELERQLAHHADYSANAFVALNTAFIEDGVYIHVPAGVKVPEPIHLLFLSAAETEPQVIHPRVLVVAEDGAAISLIETYAGVGDGLNCTNAVTEIVAGTGARVDHVKLQHETLNAYHIATQQAYLGAGARLSSHSISLGGALVRNDINTILAGEKIECILNGLYMAAGRQHVDNHMLVDHASPNCASHELYKGVLADHASAVFKGRILVRQDAQKTDAKQTNKNLLLSDDAVIDTMPQLQIYADDVKCTHGATVGQIDDEQLFYLRSRGLDADAARNLLTYAFAADVVERIESEPIRREMEDLLFARQGLTGLRVEEATW